LVSSDYQSLNNQNLFLKGTQLENTNLRKMTWFQWLVFLMPFLLPLSIASGLGFASYRGNEGIVYQNFLDVAYWFDPVFFQYTLILWLLAILVVPSFAVSYLKVMTIKKERRLLREIPVKYHGEIKRRMAQRASFGTFWGSVLCATFVVLMGMSILLLFKPVFLLVESGESGVNFALGANILMVGPYAELLSQDPKAYYSHIIRNLTAFQFGFLGAYIYFIGSLARSYFTLDLTAHTFVDGTISMIIASILALVVAFSFGSFNFGEGEAAEGTITFSQSMIPIISFFFGFYPKQALATIEQIARKITKKTDGYRSFALSTLSGMSYGQELRLNREGFDNVENLSKADVVDLAVKTCFSYAQLKQWCGEAWLIAHLREDYTHFVKCTGITSKKELQNFLVNYDPVQGDPVTLLISGLAANDSVLQQQWKTKLAALEILLVDPPQLSPPLLPAINDSRELIR
jgi:hypothetical protein